MNRMKKILTSVLSLALCVLVSFAWINEMQNREGRVLALRMKEASVATSELSVKLSENVKEDEYKEITKLCSVVEEQKLEEYENFAPGARKKFKVDITNHSDTSLTLRILLTDIICDNEELRESIIIGTNGFAGFTSDYPAPTVQNELLSVGTDASGAFTLVDSVEIPPKNLDAPVTIYFYVMFSASGSAELENMTFSIGTINFLTL